MTSTLQSLVSVLRDRYPNTLPLHNDKEPMDIEKFRFIQGNIEVVHFVMAYLNANSEEIERDELLGDDR